MLRASPRLLPPFDPLPREPRRLAIALARPRQERSWSAANEPTDFFDLKGVVEQLLRALGVHGAIFREAEHPSLHPGQTAELLVGPPGETHSLGFLGRLHPRIAERFDQAQPILLAELEMDLLDQLATDLVGSVVLPGFPGVQQDLALLVDEGVSHEQVLEELRQAGGELLSDVRLFDVYRGPPVLVGQKSLAYALTFRAPDRTLTDEDVAEVVAAIELRLAERLGARVRRS